MAFLLCGFAGCSRSPEQIKEVPPGKEGVQSATAAPVDTKSVGKARRQKARGKSPLKGEFPLRDILTVYELTSEDSVYVRPDVPLDLRVTLDSGGRSLSDEEILELIRNTLLREHGIHFRTAATGEILVDRESAQ